MDPRIRLRGIINKLEAEGLDRNPPEAGFWGDEAPELTKRRGAGRGHLSEALLFARQSLASDDENEMREAADICDSLVHTARLMGERARRAAGGQKRADAEHAKAAAFWAPFQAAFAAKVEAGTSPVMARRSIANQMARDSVTLPGGDVPASRTLLKWLRAPAEK